MNRSKPRVAWIGCTFLFVLIVLGLLALILWNPLIGLGISLLLITTFLVGSYFKYKFGKPSNTPTDVKPLSEKQLKSTQNMLRFATGILAVLSLITTANGMKSFVFDNNTLAYLGSFAVQSILVVFSLLLCRFLVQISVLKWPAYIKKLTTTLMIIFFCAALIVSSTFSFTYIANNAYQTSWPNDSETIIHTHLLNAAYKLRDENNRRGKIILDKINETAGKDLSDLASQLAENRTEELDEDLKNKLDLMVYEKQDIHAADIDINEWLDSFPKYERDIRLLYAAYESVHKPIYTKYANEYNGMIDTISQWQKDTPSTDSLKQAVDSMLSKIDLATPALNVATEQIKDWITSGQRLDHSVYKNTYTAACNTLNNELSGLQKDLQALQGIIVGLTSAEEESAKQQVDELLVSIYTLGVDASKVDLDNLVKTINDLVVEVAENNDSDSEKIRNILDLEEQIALYSEYITLKSDLNAFCKNSLAKTYTVIAKNPNSEEASIANVSENILLEDAWRDQRNADFNEFYRLVKSLPYVEKSEATQHFEHELMDEANELQRDLLSNITTFEKALLYFKYHYPIMAIFSAVVAVFFDFGSFGTGCFLYATEYFSTKQKKTTMSERTPTENDTKKVETLV